MASVYRKCLRLNNSALQAESVGRMVTLMSNDCTKVGAERGGGGLFERAGGGLVLGGESVGRIVTLNGCNKVGGKWEGGGPLSVSGRVVCRRRSSLRSDADPPPPSPFIIARSRRP